MGVSPFVTDGHKSVASSASLMTESKGQESREGGGEGKGRLAESRDGETESFEPL